MRKLSPLACLRAALAILEDVSARPPEVIAEDLDSAAALVEEAMDGLEVPGGQ